MIRRSSDPTGCDTVSTVGMKVRGGALNKCLGACGPGRYALRYNPAVDSVDDHHPYPPRHEQCASPSGIAACVTDLEVQRELDRVIGRSGDRGLHDLWFVLLPPNVDTCIAPD